MTRWVRIGAGEYETEDGRFVCYRAVDVNPPAWNIEDVSGDEERMIVDGAATKRDAYAIFEESQQVEPCECRDGGHRVEGSDRCMCGGRISR